MLDRERWTAASGDGRSAPAIPSEVGFKPEEEEGRNVKLSGLSILQLC